MERTVTSVVCLLLVAALATVNYGSAEPVARAKRDTSKGYSAQQEARMMVVGDIISYFFQQRGCSSQAVQQLLTTQCHGSANSNDQKATFKTVLNYLEMMPEDKIYVIERKVQYGSVVVSTLSKGVTGSGGSLSFKYPEFIRHLQSSKQEYNQQKSSSKVIKYIIKYMYEVDSSTYIKTSFQTLEESTCGSKGKGHGGSKGKGHGGSKDKGQGGSKGKGSKSSSSSESSGSSSSSSSSESSDSSSSSKSS